MNEIEIRKENLPDTIKELVSFLRFGQEQLNLYREKLKSSDRLDLFESKQHRDDVLEHGQIMGEALLYAEQKLGNLLKDIKTKPITDSSSDGTFGGSEKSLPEGITKKQSHYFQEMARNSEVVEQVIELTGEDPEDMLGGDWKNELEDMQVIKQLEYPTFEDCEDKIFI
jgi:hypothetical protein